MRILILHGSSRKGNTWQAVEALRDALLALDQSIAFEEIHLAQLDLPCCLGCSLCFRQGHDRCPHHAQVRQVLDGIEAADGVIFASACYQMHVTAQMKNLTDHLCFLLHRPRYYAKKALAVSTTGGVGARGATKFLRGAARGWGFNRCDMLPIAAHSWNAYEVTPKHRRRIARKAASLYRDLASGRLHAPALGPLLTYNLFRGMRVNAAPGTEYPTEDGVYWHKAGLEKGSYFPQVPMGPFRRAFGSLFYGIGLLGGRLVSVSYKR